MKNHFPNKVGVPRGNEGKIIMMSPKTKQPLTAEQFDQLSDDAPICFTFF